MKKLLFLLVTLLFVASSQWVYADDEIDIGIYATTCSDFEIRLSSQYNIAGTTLTNVQFAIKYPASVTLGDFTYPYPVALQYTTTVGADKYSVFIGVDVQINNWVAGTEYTVVTFSIDHATSANIDLIIGDDVWTAANNAMYYAELFGFDRTGIIYEDASVNLRVNNTTQGTYYCTIQQAVDAANTGNAISVATGIFYEEVSISGIDNLTITGAGEGNTIIAPYREYTTGNYGISIDNADGITIQQLTVDGFANIALTPGVAHYKDGVHWGNIGGNDCVITYVTVNNTDRRGISVWPETATNNEITYCTIDNVTGVTYGYGHGIKLSGSGKVENCDISDVTGGILGNIDIAGTVSIQNNVIYDITGATDTPFDIGINFWCKQSNVITVKNNQITAAVDNNNGIYIVRGGDGSEISGNTINLTGDGGCGIETGWENAWGFPIHTNTITMGKGGTGILVTGSGTATDPMLIYNNDLSNVGADDLFNNDYTGSYSLREVGLLLSGSRFTSRSGDADDPFFGNVYNNTVDGFKDGIVLISDPYDAGGFNQIEILLSDENSFTNYEKAARYGYDVGAFVEIDINDPNYLEQDLSLNYWGSATPDFVNVIDGKIEYCQFYTDAGFTTLSCPPVTNLDLGTRYFTIQAAIDDPLTVNGHTIEASDGLYTESNILVDKDLTIQGETRAGVIVAPEAEDVGDALSGSDGSPQNGFIIDHDGVTITNLTIDGNANNLANGGTLPDHKNQRDGITCTDGFNDLLVEDVTVNNVRRRGINLWYTVPSPTYQTIRGCHVEEADNYAIRIGADNSILENNTANNCGLGMKVFIWDMDSDPTKVSYITDNTLTNVGIMPSMPAYAANYYCEAICYYHRNNDRTVIIRGNSVSDRAGAREVIGIKVYNSDDDSFVGGPDPSHANIIVLTNNITDNLGLYLGGCAGTTVQNNIFTLTGQGRGMVLGRGGPVLTSVVPNLITENVLTTSLANNDDADWQSCGIIQSNDPAFPIHHDGWSEDPQNVFNTITYNTITNFKRGIYFHRIDHANVIDADINENIISDNELYGFDNSLNVTVVDASQNWWGYATGPYRSPDNECGQGNDVSDNVSICDWYTDIAMTPADLNGCVVLFYNVTGGGAYCDDGIGLPVGLDGSETSVNYQLYKDGSPVGTPIAGDGNAIDFGDQIDAGTYTVQATNTITGCADVVMTGSVTIILNLLPAAPTAGDVNVVYDGLPHTGTATAPGGSTVVWYNASTGGSVTVAPYGTNVGIYTAWAESEDDLTACVSDTRTLVTVTITEAPLTITANDDAKVYDGLAYSGGNGVVYSGFVNGETEAVLSGTLTYGGNSQGAINVGSYDITPGGLSSTNYNITFDDGELTITPITLALKVMLQGPYSLGAGTMNTDLNTNGQIPNGQPFNVAPWNYTGTETLPGSLSPDVVDWVLVELRTGTEASTMIGRSAGLVYKNGTVSVSINDVAFPDVVSGSGYNIVIWHRNHIPVMSASTQTVPVTSYDFTVLTNLYGHGNLAPDKPAIDLGSGTYGMIAGDVTHNGELKYSGPGNDRGAVLAQISLEGGTLTTSVITDGYWFADVNMNNELKYNGGNNDRAYIIDNLVELVETSYLNNIYTSVVPGAYTGSKDGSNEGPFDIQFVESAQALSVVIAATETVVDGLVDNIQFTLAWKAEDTEIADMLETYTSDFMLAPQGEAYEVNGVIHMVYVSITPVDLPAVFDVGEQVSVLSFVKESGISTTGRLWIANNEFTADNNAMYFVSNWGSDVTGMILTSMTGVNDPSAENLIQVYPNPTHNDFINMELNLVKDQIVTIHIMDMQGKTVVSTEIPAKAGQSVNRIELNNPGQGVYLIKVLGDKLNTIEKLIVR